MTLPWTGGILTAPQAGGLPAMLGGFTIAREGEPQSNSVCLAAIQFDDSADAYMANTTPAVLGFANAWTIQLWFCHQNTGTTGTVFEIGGAANTSRIKFSATTSGAAAIELDNAAGTLFKSYTYAAGVFTSDDWHCYAITWNGTSLVLYKNGVVQAPTATTTDDADSMANGARDVVLGSDAAGTDSVRGSMTNMVIWDVALTQNQLRSAFNQGAASHFNALRNQDDYGQASDVVQWWRLGHKPSDFGKSFVTTGAVDADTNSVNITAAGDMEVQGPFFATVDFATDEIARYGVAASTGGSTTTTLGIANTFTFECWVRCDSIAASTIFDANAGDSDVNRDSDDRLQLRLNSSNFEFRIFDSSGTGITLVSSVNAVVNRWYHIVVVKEATTEARLYVNSVEDDAETVSVPTTTDAARIVGVGALAIGATSPFDGKVGSIALWNVDLTDAAIVSLFNGGSRSMNRRKNFDAYVGYVNNLKHWFRFGRPKGVEGAGGDYVTDFVPSGGIDLTANAANLSAADVHLVDQTVGARNGFAATVDLDGTADYIAQTTAASIGITNSWSISVWVRPDDLTALRGILELTTSGTNANRIYLQFAGTIANDPYEWIVTASGGTLLKDYRYIGRFAHAVAAWNHVVATWNAGTLLGYVDGVLVTPSIITDDAVTQTATDRRVYYGVRGRDGDRFWDGQIGHAAIWNSVLTADEILELYSKGHMMDLKSAGQDYASQAALQHWWKPGENPSDIGNDYQGSIDLAPVSIDDTAVQVNSPFKDISA